jgi:D-alanyl-lipoteichoic acid acyltransferase DltB (MBOAT superfamily)
MGKIKVKDIEGDPKDIQFLFQEGDFNLAGYLGAEAARKKVKDKWILMLISTLFILSCCIWNDAFNSVWTKVTILAAFFLSFFILLIVHSNYRSKAITTIVVVALAVNILLILKVYSPQEVARRIEDITIEGYKNKK